MSRCIFRCKFSTLPIRCASRPAWVLGVEVIAITIIIFLIVIIRIIATIVTAVIIFS